MEYYSAIKKKPITDNHHMTKSCRHHIEEKMPDTEHHRLYDSIYIPKGNEKVIPYCWR